METLLSAGVIPLRATPMGWRCLLLRCYGYWDFPKGEVEPGEDPLAAAVREVAEESGIGDLRFPWGHDFHETPRYGRGKIARYYLGRTDTAEVVLGINPELGGPEHHEYRWVDGKEARRLLNDRVAAALDWALMRVESRGEGSQTSGQTTS